MKTGVVVVRCVDGAARPAPAVIWTPGHDGMGDLCTHSSPHGELPNEIRAHERICRGRLPIWSRRSWVWRRRYDSLEAARRVTTKLPIIWRRSIGASSWRDDSTCMGRHRRDRGSKPAWCPRARRRETTQWGIVGAPLARRWRQWTWLPRGLRDSVRAAGGCAVCQPGGLPEHDGLGSRRPFRCSCSREPLRDQPIARC